jgi:DNA-binding transcriptional MerR regulator
MTQLKTDEQLELRPYRSISEVSDLVGVKAHVLRYWETQFSMLRPKKNRAGNRMYRPEEVKLLLRIKDLLYDRRFTIAGARRRLLDERKETSQIQIFERPAKSADQKIVLHEVKNELRRLLARLRGREEPAEA